MKITKKNHKSGQAAIAALFIMTVIVTVGLAMISRTITDVQISETGEQGIRAFSAAEAGIEGAFEVDWGELGGFSGVSLGGLSADVETIAYNQVEEELKQGEYLFVKADRASFTVSKKDPASGGLEIILYDGGDGYKKEVYGDCVSESLGGGVSGITVSGATAVSIRVLCSDGTVEVSGGLPVQKYDIKSKAESLEGKTGAIEGSRTVSGYPPMFDYVLFTTGSLGTD